MRLKLLSAAVAALIMLAGSASAAPSQRSMELAKRYFAAVQMDRLLANVMANIAPAMLEGIAKARNVTVSSELTMAFAKASEDSMRAMTPRMVEIMVPIVAETFTEAELEAAVAYYESPAAQSMLAKNGALNTKLIPALQHLAPELEKDLIARFCADVGCDPTPAR